MHIMGNMLDGWGDGVPGCEGRVHDNTEVFYLEVGLVQGFKGAPIIKVVVKWNGKMEVHDGGDKCGVFSRGREQAEVVTIDRDVDREDGGNFYSKWRGRSNYWGRNRQRRQGGEFWTTRQWSVFGEPEFDLLCGEGKTGGPSGSGDIGGKGIGG